MSSSINVCFSTTSGKFSRLIRWFTRSNVSHALLTFRDETLNKVFVMEANGRGFMLVPWSKWKRHNQVVARYKLLADKDVQLASLRTLSSSLGAEYDYIGILGFLLRRFFKRMANPFDNPTKMFCSEVVAQFLLKAGFPRFDSPETWTPQDLLEVAQKHKRFVPLPNVEPPSTQSSGPAASG